MTRRRPGLGIALVLAMAACFAALDNSVRWLGAALPVLVILSVRYAFQALAMTAWLAVDPKHGFRSAHPRFQALRGALLLATSGFSFFGVQHMPVPEFTAINMLTPVLVTLMAGWFLGERVSRLRWLLVVGAFAGALIVIRPGSGVFGWAVLFPLGGALTYASFQVLTSRMAALENPYTTHFWTGFTGTVILLPVLLAGPVDAVGALNAATPAQWGWMALIGLLGTGGHLMLILAMGMAPTSTLMPFVYTQIGAAALFGWLLFRHLPDGWAWVGMAVIAACGAGSAWLNLKGTAPKPSSAVGADTIAD
ncbi:DMT family transporter [Rubrivivax gelatinosus]|uniref:EamA-like transporter family protein n=1 Tax=Rubrivivax gelatinosus TaxID=28068 RepID=A0A4R2MBB2_RUBGE|nr:DMT family transporter [Rubrivivax gelatinosus]MBK1687380.1 transporter [Rubrivivax gelatinosus]TCO99825.1 EamA-like transporter family protein [Rubrivivax gelatinosus]